MAVSSTSIQISWLPPDADSLNGVLRYYRVLITDPSGVLEYDSLVNGDSLEVVISELHPHTVYNCTVVGVTVREGPAAEVQIETLEDGKPRS